MIPNVFKPPAPAPVTVTVAICRKVLTETDDAHGDVIKIKWKHFPRYWPFVRGIHRTPVNSPHKGQ